MSEEQVTRRTAVSAIGISVAALAAGGLAFVNSSADQPIGGGGGVASLNALTGALDITAGAGISVTPSGSNIQIAATGGGGGDTITSPNSTLNVGGTSSNTTLDVNAAAFPLSFIPGTASSLDLGSAAYPWRNINGGNFLSFVTAGDAQPGTVMASGGISFGPGGATATSSEIQYGGSSGALYITNKVASAKTSVSIFGNGPGSGLANSALNLYSISGGSSEYLSIIAYQQNSYQIAAQAVGSGTVRNIKALTPWIFNSFALNILGSSTGYTTLTTANASATDYTATFPANTGTVAELNLVQTFTQVIQTSQNGDTSNTGFGTGALNVNTGSYNSAFGHNAGGANTTGNYNSFFGFDAGYSNTTGGDNSFFGEYAGYSNTIGGGNSFFGPVSGYSNTTGNYNSFFGQASGYSNTIGGGNSFFGQIAGANFNDTTGASDYLVAFGYQAGYNYTGTERNNVVLGGNTLGVAGESNVIRIGANGLGIFLPNSNTLVGHGVPGEYASTGITPVALSTVSTVIDTYTPTANGQFLVMVSVVGKTATTLTSLTVTYTDINTGVTTTQTLAAAPAGVAIGLNAAVTYSALCPATTASAISVQGTAALASDLYASAAFFVSVI